MAKGRIRMARPKKAQGVPTARDRIKGEFWRLYEERPLERISVKEVCQAAGCNKTTFYYHFQDLRAVLEEIEEECLPIEAPAMLSELMEAADAAQIVSQFIERMGERFERYCLLLSSRGDPDFAKKARVAMTNRWCESLGIDYGALSEADRTTIRFAMGGAGSIFADHGDGEPFDGDAFARAVLGAVLPLASKYAS